MCGVCKERQKCIFCILDLEKAYNRVDRKAMWNVLRLYGVGGKLLKAVKSLYVGSKACVRVGNELSDWFEVRVGLRQGCVMSPWLFNLYIDGVVREVNARVLGHGLELIDANEIAWQLNQLLFVDDTVVVADSEKLCQLVTEFGVTIDFSLILVLDLSVGLEIVFLSLLSQCSLKKGRCDDRICIYTCFGLITVDYLL